MSKEKNIKTSSNFNLDTSYTQNRELSWLRFNERVMFEAIDSNVPLYERLKFIAIFTSNLDEFFMVRVGSIHDLSLLKQPPIDNKTGMTPSEQLDAVFKDCAPLYKKRDAIFSDLETNLRQRDICNLSWQELNKKDKEYVKEYFEDFINPVLSPQIVDMHHPFPHLINNELYICVSLKYEGDKVFGILPVPAMLPKFLVLPGSGTLRYIMLENILLKFSEQIFSMYSVNSKSIIRVTRNADINPDDEQFDVDDDYRHHMKKVLKKRGRLCPVRLEVQKHKQNSSDIIDFLTKKLNLEQQQVFQSSSPLSMGYIFSLGDKFPKTTLNALSYEPFSPQLSVSVNPKESMMRQILRKDILLFYPYEKMDSFLNLVKEASEDPNVISIKITIYRMASNSKLVEYLTNAVENQKEVTVLMELRARFDEQNNINWSSELEQAGCKIIYGFEGFKVHSKICLITRKEKNRIQHFTQIGTGNYNEKTAKMYTDLCLLTSDDEIGADAATFFQNMAISNLDGEYDKLLVAPYALKPGLMDAIDRQIELGEKGQITLKMNSLTDRDLMEKLSEASIAGVKITLNVRGICCLLPGVPGKTENIVVKSIVGRYLEHPRIFCFGSELDDMEIYIGSADMMTRNTEKRVEIIAPLLDKKIKRYIVNIMEIIDRDTIKARRMRPDGVYEKLPLEGAVAIDSQAYFMNIAKTFARCAAENQKKKQSFFFRLKQKLFRR